MVVFMMQQGNTGTVLLHSADLLGVSTPKDQPDAVHSMLTPSLCCPYRVKGLYQLYVSTRKMAMWTLQNGQEVFIEIFFVNVKDKDTG